jgi:hypothetical protein
LNFLHCGQSIALASVTEIVPDPVPPHAVTPPTFRAQDEDEIYQGGSLPVEADGTARGENVTIPSLSGTPDGAVLSLPHGLEHHTTPVDLVVRPPSEASAVSPQVPISGRRGDAGLAFWMMAAAFLASELSGVAIEARGCHSAPASCALPCGSVIQLVGLPRFEILPRCLAGVERAFDTLDVRTWIGRPRDRIG